MTDFIMPLQPHSRLESEEVLKILRLIKKSPELTQRELSSKLGISLGKVNFLLNALIRKGYVKAQNFKNSHNKKAYLYILTPQGIEQKAKVTYRFLKRKTEEYEQLEAEIKQLKKEASDLGIEIKAEDRS